MRNRSPAVAIAPVSPRLTGFDNFPLCDVLFCFVCCCLPLPLLKSESWLPSTPARRWEVLTELQDIAAERERLLEALQVRAQLETLNPKPVMMMQASVR